jgi:hypothetical protein
VTFSTNVEHIREPLLAFGGGHRHQDVRFGLVEFGPVDLDPARQRFVRVGIVGNAKTTDGLRQWLRKCEGGIPPKNSRQPNLFPAFPAGMENGPFRCRFLSEDRDIVVVPPAIITKITGEIRDDVAMTLALQLFADEIEALAQKDNPPNVIVCALPVEIIERVKNMRVSTENEDADDEKVYEDDVHVQDFRGALKARALAFKVPIQIVWPTTYDNSAVIMRKLARYSERRVQDEATRAWNFFCALYYKAGGTPWRLVRDSKAYDTAFVGISFFENLAGRALLTSSAQMFDERGEGLILQGGRAMHDKIDRHPYLSGDDAHALLTRTLAAYKREHGNHPARLVIHKSSSFHADERAGFERALDECGVGYADLIWLPRHSPVKLFRNGLYPPLRGTALKLDDDQVVLYTRGSVDFFRTYPGMYVPNPLWLRLERRDTASLDQVLTELLTLTKMNWNGTQFDGALPITMKAARQVGDILKHVREGDPADPRYRFYM